MKEQRGRGASFRGLSAVAGAKWKTPKSFTPATVLFYFTRVILIYGFRAQQRSFLSGILPEVVEVQVFHYRPSNLMILIGQNVAFQHITGSFFFVTSLSSIQAIKSYFKGSARKLHWEGIPTTKICNTFQTKCIRDYWEL